MQVPFNSLINQLYAERMKDLSRQPSKLKWFWNSKGLRETIFSAQTMAIRSDGTATSIGEISFHYADQNPTGRSKEAYLVRNGILAKHHVGWLWTNINGEIRWLGKVVNHYGKITATALNSGWVDKGIMFLNLKK